MKMRHKHNLLLVGVATGLLLVGGCTRDNDIDLASYVEATEPADVLYNQGLANLNAGRLTEASAKFRSVDRQHPYSEYARKAVVMSSFTAYRQGKYDDAVTDAKRYVALYPNSEDAAYAHYLIGLSYYRQIKDVTRDQREASQTITAMRELLERFPESEYVEDAEAKIRFARDQLAGKEMQIGRYYQERREYTAAIKRFRGVVETFSNTRHVEEALARLTETYYAMGLVSEAQTAAAILGHNYPDSQWYKDSYNLLQKGGHSPRVVGTSWLTRSAKKITGTGSDA